MSIAETIADIKALRIQGAESIAIAATKAVNDVAQKSKASSRKRLLRELHSAQHEFILSRPTEPKMRNSLKHLLAKLKSREVAELKKEISEKTHEITAHFTDSRQYISHLGSLKIKDNMIIFTHCHSSTVMSILKLAKAKNTRFYVHNTETRPLYQGRISAKELASANIPVQHYVDSAAMLALKDADIILIGADAILKNGDVVNKIGSRMLAELAEFQGVKVYVCANSWAYDPETKHHPEKIELREPSEIWDNAPKGIKIINPAFEVIPANLITGIISELGIFKPEIFLYKVKRNYPWLR